MLSQPGAQILTAPLPSVLIVDGDPDTRALYAAIFGPISRNVYEAEDGAEALGKAICHRPALIVMETYLRRIDGVALCQLLRSDPATRSASIIVLTSAASPGDHVRAIKAGANQVLVKPCTPEALIACAQQLCDVAAPPVQMSQPSQRLPRAPHAEVPAEATAASAPRKRSRSRTFLRELTTTPPTLPPPLHCPTCDAMLIYGHSHIGGVNESIAEQWDYFRCERCGPYQYRHRTRKLRAT
jgi:CheY-like chemotaxis protein